MINLIKYGIEDIKMTNTPSKIESDHETHIKESFERYESEHEPPTLLSNAVYVCKIIFAVFAAIHGVPPPPLFFSGPYRRKRTRNNGSKKENINVDG
jgi:hypothetical protein